MKSFIKPICFIGGIYIYFIIKTTSMKWLSTKMTLIVLFSCHHTWTDGFLCLMKTFYSVSKMYTF